MRTSHIVKLKLFVSYFCTLRRIFADTVLCLEDTPSIEEYDSQFIALYSGLGSCKFLVFLHFFGV